MFTDRRILEEERDSLKSQLRQHYKNLARLEERAAKYTIDVPISVLNEIDEVKERIERDKARLEEILTELEQAPPEEPSAELVRPGAEKRRIPRRAVLLAALGLVVLGVSIGMWRQILSLITPIPVELTPQPTSTLPATLAPSVPAEPTPWPTSTPLVPLPVPVALEDEGCAEYYDRVAEDIQRAGGTLVELGSAQMQVEMQCDGEQTTIVARFPEKPAYLIEFLDDEALVLSVETKMAYGRAFIQAAVAYASGNYEQAARLLEQASSHLTAPDAYLLHAQALMHLERWKDARGAYTAALEGWPETEAAQRARAYAGRGLVRMFRVQQTYGVDEDALEECERFAAGDFEAAMAAQSDRPLWMAGRALARLRCPGDDPDMAAVVNDVKTAVEQTTGTAMSDEAMILGAAAFVYWFTGDTVQAIDLAQRSIDLAPELSTPYYVLLNTYIRNNEREKALEAYQDCWARLALPWQRQDLQVLVNLELGQPPQ